MVESQPTPRYGKSITGGVISMTEKERKVKNNKPPSDKYVKYTYDKDTKITEIEFRQAPPVKEEDREDDSRN